MATVYPLQTFDSPSDYFEFVYNHSNQEEDAIHCAMVNGVCISGRTDRIEAWKRRVGKKFNPQYYINESKGSVELPITSNYPGQVHFNISKPYTSDLELADVVNKRIVQALQDKINPDKYRVYYRTQGQEILVNNRRVGAFQTLVSNDRTVFGLTLFVLDPDYVKEWPILPFCNVIDARENSWLNKYFEDAMTLEELCDYITPHIHAAVFE